MVTKLCLAAVVVVVFAGFSSGALRCPLTGCPYIWYPDECRATSFLVLPDRQICSQCDRCMNATETGLDDNGCPLIACPAIYHPPECTGRKLFLYRGQLCNDCDINVCPFDDDDNDE